MRIHTRPFTSARLRTQLFALLLLLLGLAAAPLQTALAASTTIDFGIVRTDFNPYHEDGFTLTAVANGGNDPVGRVHVTDFVSPGNFLAHPSSGFEDQDIILSNDAGLPFNLSSIDLIEATSFPSPQTITIQGTRTDSTVVEQTFTTDGVAGRETFLLSNFTNLTTVRLGAGASTAEVAVDNLILDVAEVEYIFDGFAAPVDSAPTLNSAKAGQVIPLKWRLTDASGSPVTDLAIASVKVASLECSSGATSDAIEEYAAGGSGLQNLGDGYYQYNWKTPKSYAGSCKTLKLDLGVGQEHSTLFQFK
jgi:hypothetical protein